jgi:hypothetical protein
MGEKPKPRTVFYFKFPLPPDRGNRRGHSRWEKFGNKRRGLMSWSEFNMASNLLNLREKVSIPTLKYALIWAHFRVIHRRRDFDNLDAWLKWPLDWLRKHAILLNDSAARLWPVQHPTQELVEKIDDTGLEIVLNETTKEMVEHYSRFGPQSHHDLRKTGSA